MKYMHQFTRVFSNVIRLNTDCLRVNRRAVYCGIVIAIIAECRRICFVLGSVRLRLVGDIASSSVLRPSLLHRLS